MNRLALIAIFALSACYVSTDPDPDPRPEPECYYNSDCGPGWECVGAGVCVEIDYPGWECGTTVLDIGCWDATGSYEGQTRTNLDCESGYDVVVVDYYYICDPYYPTYGWGRVCGC